MVRLCLSSSEILYWLGGFGLSQYELGHASAYHLEEVTSVVHVLHKDRLTTLDCSQEIFCKHMECQKFSSISICYEVIGRGNFPSCEIDLREITCSLYQRCIIAKMAYGQAFKYLIIMKHSGNSKKRYFMTIPFRYLITLVIPDVWGLLLEIQVLEPAEVA